MNVKELFDHKKTVYSMEVFPPKKAGSVETVYNTLYGLRGLPIDFISVTYGAGGSEVQKNKTAEIASLIKMYLRIRIRLLIQNLIGRYIMAMHSFA